MDRYTKLILTVIAACLIYLSARDFIPANAYARYGEMQAPVPVLIVGVERNVANGSAIPVTIIK